MDTLENKIIGQFMGREEGYDEHGRWQPLQYNTSWDWLMPIWAKCIEVIGIWAHTHSNERFSKIWLEASARISSSLSSVDIVKANIEIKHLIQWYNQNK